MRDLFKNVIIIVAIPLLFIGILPMFMPKFLDILPHCFKNQEYLNFIGNYSVAAGSFIGFILLTLAYLQQEKKHNQEIFEIERRKKEEMVERYIKSFEEIKIKLKYRQFVGKPGLVDFHKNVIDYLIKHSENLEDFHSIKITLKKAVDGSTFTKGGGLNLYKRSLDKVMKKLNDLTVTDLIPFFEDTLLEEEKALIFYLYKYYFPKNNDFIFLIHNGFLESLDPTYLASENHIEWLK